MFHVTRVLYATDFSSYSNQAYFHAIALAERYEASLTILNVWHEQADCGSSEGCRRQLETIRPENAGIPIRHVFLEGDPAEEIVRYANENNVGLIVMGTHDRTGAERQLMGSVAERVMRGAACSVLVVKLPKGQPAYDRPSAELVGSA